MPIDVPTYDRYLRAEEKSVSEGRSFAEVLDYERLLLTQARERQIKLDLAKAIYDRLKQKSPMDLLRVFNGSDTGTAGQMFEATQAWLMAICQALEKNSWEE